MLAIERAFGFLEKEKKRKENQKERKEVKRKENESINKSEKKEKKMSGQA